MNLFDTIVAPITGTEPAAVAVVRVSGRDAFRIAKAVFPSWPAEPEPRRALYGRFATGDDGLALPFEEGHSYTGDLTVEFSVHGSRASVLALLSACCDGGARPAEPGEFTRRAFMNGRMDLTQAEAVRETVEAETESQLRLANAMRSGDLRRVVSGLRERVVHQIASIEASVDFSEEVGDLDRSAATVELESVRAGIARLLATANMGRIMRQGLRIAIVGKPNVGKSSLMNALLGTDRAIVTDVPGTTRDTLEEKVDVGGVPCVLTDTAGLRLAEDLVEKLGVERSHRAAAEADLVWYVADVTMGLDSDDRAVLDGLSQPVWLIINKSDLQPQTPCAEGYRVSALTCDGLDTLARAIAEFAGIAGVEGRWMAVNDRHVSHLREADARLVEALETLDGPLPTDLVSIHLQGVAMELGLITGETATLDIVDRVFRDFCVGK